MNYVFLNGGNCLLTQPRSPTHRPLPDRSVGRLSSGSPRRPPERWAKRRDLARALGRGRPGLLGWRDLDEALARGWWCAATRQPEAVVRGMAQGARTDVTFDLSPADLAFTPAAFTEIDQA